MDKVASFLPVFTLPLPVCRSLPQQGHALSWDAALAAGHPLQRQQPLLPEPHSWGGPRGRGQLQRLHVSKNQTRRLVLELQEPPVGSLEEAPGSSMVPSTRPEPSPSSLLRISRLFSDAKKILLYSQNDKNLDGFKELSQALQLLQKSRSGRSRCC